MMPCSSIYEYIMIYYSSTLLVVDMLLLMFPHLIHHCKKESISCLLGHVCKNFSMIYIEKWNCWIILYPNYCKVFSKVITCIYIYTGTLKKLFCTNFNKILYNLYIIANLICQFSCLHICIRFLSTYVWHIALRDYNSRRNICGHCVLLWLYSFFNVLALFT